VARFLGIDAGPFRLAVPLSSVRQIVDMGGALSAPAAANEAAANEAPFISLATLLGVAPSLTSSSSRPAAFRIDGVDGVVTCCGLRGVIDASEPRPLPQTVACRFPGLLRGTIIDDDALALVVDAAVLAGLIEAAERPAGGS
jgi:hypothetical protein